MNNTYIFNSKDVGMPSPETKKRVALLRLAFLILYVILIVTLQNYIGWLILRVIASVALTILVALIVYLGLSETSNLIIYSNRLIYFNKEIYFTEIEKIEIVDEIINNDNKSIKCLEIHYITEKGLKKFPIPFPYLPPLDEVKEIFGDKLIEIE